jgi:hypothetical protein
MTVWSRPENSDIIPLAKLQVNCCFVFDYDIMWSAVRDSDAIGFAKSDEYMPMPTTLNRN